MNFENYFKKNKSQIISNKFLIILGSGIHKQANASQETILSSWYLLLKKLGSKLPLQSSIVEFEQIIYKKTRNKSTKAARDIEKSILKEASNYILREQDKILTNSDIRYPMDIFNPLYVSDVVNLNFDLVIESILSPNEKLKKLKINDYKNLNARRQLNGINFWHPHGDILNPEYMSLGLREYGNHIKKIEEFRKSFKQTEKNNKIQEGWLSKLMTQPILIIGADLSQNEWDIWFALINRNRNYARNKKSEKPVFKMKGNCTSSDSDVLFHGISHKILDFNEEWRIITEILSQK